jgi:hypothetical protein
MRASQHWTKRPYAPSQADVNQKDRPLKNRWENTQREAKGRQGKLPLAHLPPTPPLLEGVVVIAFGDIPCSPTPPLLEGVVVIAFGDIPCSPTPL